LLKNAKNNSATKKIIQSQSILPKQVGLQADTFYHFHYRIELSI